MGRMFDYKQAGVILTEAEKGKTQRELERILPAHERALLLPEADLEGKLSEKDLLVLGEKLQIPPADVEETMKRLYPIYEELARQRAYKIDEKMEYTEPVHYNVNRRVRELGFITASSNGIRTQLVASDFGVLDPTEVITIQKRRFFFWKSHQQRAKWLATVYLDRDDSWQVNFYGRENREKVTELMKNLAAPYDNVKVQIRLASEHSRFEAHADDYSCD